MTLRRHEEPCPSQGFRGQTRVRESGMTNHDAKGMFAVGGTDRVTAALPKLAKLPRFGGCHLFLSKCFPVDTEEYFYQVVRYVERNALRANLVERAEAWPWSSLRRTDGEDPASPILSPWPLPRPADWLQLVNQPQTEAELAALRCCVAAVNPSAIRAGSRTLPRNWDWNGRSGPAEDRRNLLILPMLRVKLFYLAQNTQFWWLSPFLVRRGCLHFFRCV